MTPILPGQEYEITVAGKPYKVKALTGAQQMQLAEHLDVAIAREADAGKGNVVELMRAAKGCLDVAVGKDQADEMWSSTVNASMAIEISLAVFSSNQLSGDEAKN